MHSKFFAAGHVREKYIRAGKRFHAAREQFDAGNPSDLHEALEDWSRWEREFARNGFRTYRLDEIIEQPETLQSGESLGQKRKSSETPVYHAEAYYARYFPKQARA